MSADDGGWERPKRRRGARPAPPPACALRAAPRRGVLDADEETRARAEAEAKRVEQIIRRGARELEKSAFYAALLDDLKGVVRRGGAGTDGAVRAAGVEGDDAEAGRAGGRRSPLSFGATPFTRVVALGVGSPSESRDLCAAHQIALAHLLSREYGCPCHVYDPVMTLADSLACRALGMQVPQSLEASVELWAPDGSTLLYLAHCSADLTADVIARALRVGDGDGDSFAPAPRAHEAAVLLGNRIAAWAAMETPDRDGATAKRRDAAGRLFRELIDRGHVRQRNVPERGYPILSAFNELAIHTFSRPDSS